MSERPRRSVYNVDIDAHESEEITFNDWVASMRKELRRHGLNGNAQVITWGDNGHCMLEAHLFGDK